MYLICFIILIIIIGGGKMWVLVIVLMSSDAALTKEFPTKFECESAIENVERYVSKESLKEIYDIYCDTKENVDFVELK